MKERDVHIRAIPLIKQVKGRGEEAAAFLRSQTLEPAWEAMRESEWPERFASSRPRQVPRERMRKADQVVQAYEEMIILQHNGYIPLCYAAKEV